MSDVTRGLWDWSKERFPALNIVSGFIMYFMVASVAQRMGFGAVHYGPPQLLLGGLAITLLFLILRVSDEHKDYQSDMKLFPERVLQSGRVELRHLRYVGGAAVLLVFGISYYLDGGVGKVTAAATLNIALALMLNREFFVGTWLRRHMMLYALSHMVIAITATFWIAKMAGIEQWNRPMSALLLLPYWSGMVFEIARKSFGAEENKGGLESYSLIFGYSRAAQLTVVFGALAFAVYLLLVNMVAPGHWYSILLSAFFLATLVWTSREYSSHPTKRNRKKVEGVAALFITFNYLSLGILCFI